MAENKVIVNGVEVDTKKAERLMSKLVIMERNNIKSRQLNDGEMVKKIKKMIEEEVGCY